MSETTGAATGVPLEAPRPGSVGVPVAGIEVRLAEDGELLVRGGTVTPGYYKDPQRTAELLDTEGWLHSGDLGRVDEDGYFYVVDRKKELLITSYGKNISLAAVEALLKHHALVGQAMAVGDGRPYITALLVLDYEVAPGWAQAHGIAAGAPEELAGHPAVVAELRRAVADANGHLSHPEQVKRFTILPAEWTAESEELTPLLKLKRHVILQKYAGEIAAMYAEPPSGHEPAGEGAPASLMTRQ
jgi:long-chain acyl-CoA synthetase